MLVTNLQSAIDKLEIQEVCATYAFTYDSGDIEGWLACFTEDLTWELRIPVRDEPVHAVNGRQALLDMVTANIPELEKQYADVLAVQGSFHTMGGMVFDELTQTTAKTRTMCFPILQSFQDDGRELDLTNWHSILKAEVLFAGIYHNWYRKVDGEWKISKKVYYASAGPLKD